MEGDKELCLNDRANLVFVRPAGFTSHQCVEFISKCFKLSDFIVDVAQVVARDLLDVFTGLLALRCQIEERLYFFECYTERLGSSYKQQQFNRIVSINPVPVWSSSCGSKDSSRFIESDRRRLNSNLAGD